MKPKPKPATVNLVPAVKRAGGNRVVAEQIGVTPEAIRQWSTSGIVPPLRVLEFAAVVGVPKHKVSPDLYPT